MKKTEIIFGILWIVLGLALTLFSVFETVDEFWSGMGSALLVIGIIRLFRGYRLSKSDIYKEKREVAQTDERFHFIRNKAWAWSGYLFIIIASICTILFKIFDKDQLCLFSSGAVCLMLILHWITFFILKKKY